MARKQDWTYDPRLRELLLAFLRMVKIAQRPYAIGGALAMSAHGYQRHTSDVDAFLREEDRLVWLRAAHQVGLTVDRVFGTFHFIAFFPKHGDPRIRIDMLFPAGDPELSAIDNTIPGSVGGIAVSVFPLEQLVISKCMSERPEDARDFDVMFELGLFDPNTVRAVLALMDSDEGADDLFVKRIKGLLAAAQTAKPMRKRGK